MRGAVLPAALVTAVLTGCALQPTGVVEERAAPTGVAPGVTLYFLDADGRLEPQVRETGSLGTVGDAVSLLLDGPGGSGAATGIADVQVTRVGVVVDGDEVHLRLPLSSAEVAPAGLDQIACTALAAHVQAGGSAAAVVHLDLTVPGDGTAGARTCPVLGAG